MHAHRTSIQIALAACAALFAFAFVAAPRSCEWGLEAYFWAGIACTVGLFALPFVLRAGPPAPRRASLALALAGMACAIWIAGLFFANVRIMCRLF